MSRINSSNPPDRIDTGRATQDHHHPGPTQSQLQYQQPHQWTKSAETLQQDFQDADHGCYEQSAKSEEGSVNLEDAESDERDTETGQEESVTQQQRREARKLRRFRLTRNQTRFLLNEFAHQVHPDATQREQLSREIPGLSPRQVQVWFQNRRAKLRQLPIEDRNNMMSSRAIPEDFDMPHTLYPTPHTVVPQSYTAQEFGGQLSPVANDASRFLYPGIEENVSIMSPLRRPAMGQSINSPSRTRTEIKTIPTPSIATYTTERVSHIPSSIGSQSHSTVWHQSSRGHEDPLNSRSTSLPPQMTPQIPQSNSPIDELSTIEIDIANRSWEGSASPRTDDVFASYGTEAMVQTAYTGRVLSQREFEADASTFSSIAAFPYESSISSWKNLPLQGNNQLMIGRDHNEPPSAHGRLLRSSSVADFNPGSTYLRSVDQHPQFYVSRSASQLQPGGRIAPAGHTFMSCHVHDPPTAKTWTPDLPYQSTSLGPNQNSFSTNLSEGPYAEHTFGDHDIDVSHYVTRHGTEPED